MKEIPLEFIRLVDEDIRRIDLLLSKNADEREFEQLHREIDAKYQACVKNWGMSMWGYNKQFGFTYSFLDKTSLIENLSMMKSKLTSFKYSVNAIPNAIPNVVVSIENNIAVQVSFEEVRSKIQNMKSLTVEETEEVISKINEIEQIVKLPDTKKKKWEKLKPVFLWLGNKSVDVGLSLLPLILKIQ